MSIHKIADRVYIKLLQQHLNAHVSMQDNDYWVISVKNCQSKISFEHMENSIRILVRNHLNKLKAFDESNTIQEISDFITGGHHA